MYMRLRVSQCVLRMCSSADTKCARPPSCSFSLSQRNQLSSAQSDRSGTEVDGKVLKRLLPRVLTRAWGGSCLADRYRVPHGPSTASPESWQYVLLFPFLVWPYSSPMSTIGTPCDMSSATMKLRT